MVTIHSSNLKFSTQYNISEIKHSAIAPKLKSSDTAPKLKLNLLHLLEFNYIDLQTNVTAFQ